MEEKLMAESKKEEAEKKETTENPGSDQKERAQTEEKSSSPGIRVERSERPGYRPRFTGGGRRSFYSRKRFCLLCKKDLYEELDYKNEALLRRFITEKGKILPRRISGLCARAQRLVKREIKRARMVAILPFTQK